MMFSVGCNNVFRGHSPLSEGPVDASPCSGSGTSCILRQLLSQGLVRGEYQARANFVGEEESDVSHGHEVIGGGVDQRSNRNSKFRPDCWGEETPGLRQERGVYQSNRRGRGRDRGRGEGAPCLWETEYYMGDNVDV